MSDLVKLTEYSVWANEQWIGFIESTFPDDEYLLKRMGHVLLGEQAWFQRISREEPDRNIWKMMTVPALRAMHRAHKEVYRTLLDGSLERTLAYQRFTGEEYQSPVADILLHLSMHGVHHRGQMATYVSAKGVARSIRISFSSVLSTGGKAQIKTSQRWNAGHPDPSERTARQSRGS